MRVLFDHGTPDPLRTSLTLHDVSTAYEKGWSKLRNGDLLTLPNARGMMSWSVPTASPCRSVLAIAWAVMGFVVVGVQRPAYLGRRFRLLLLDSKWVRTYDEANHSGHCGLLCGKNSDRKELI